MLQAPRVATPCVVPWDSMEGDAHVRFCGRCSKSVYNLSSMTQSEAAQLLERHAGACIRYYERPDETLLTSDCPVGRQTRRTRRVRALATAAVGTAALGVLAAAVTAWAPAPIAHKSVDELVINSDVMAGRVVRVEGTLVSGSIEKTAPGGEVRFALASRGVVLPVRYRAAVLPDTFRDRGDTPVDVVVEGKLLEDGDFLATDLLAKSPMGYFLENRSSRGSEPAQASRPHDSSAPPSIWN